MTLFVRATGLPFRHRQAMVGMLHPNRARALVKGGDAIFFGQRLARKTGSSRSGLTASNRPLHLINNPASRSLAETADRFLLPFPAIWKRGKQVSEGKQCQQPSSVRLSLVKEPKGEGAKGDIPDSSCLQS